MHKIKARPKDNSGVWDTDQFTGVQKLNEMLVKKITAGEFDTDIDDMEDGREQKRKVSCYASCGSFCRESLCNQSCKTTYAVVDNDSTAVRPCRRTPSLIDGLNQAWRRNIRKPDV